MNEQTPSTYQPTVEEEVCSELLAQRERLRKEATPTLSHNFLITGEQLKGVIGIFQKAQDSEWLNPKSGRVVDLTAAIQELTSLPELEDFLVK